jgi:hypothetical protein
MEYTSEQVRNFIIDNFDPTGRQILRWSELARKTGISSRTLSHYIKRLRTEGKIPEPRKPHTKIAHETWKSGNTNPLEGITSLKGAKTREERIAILSNVASLGADIAKIQAVRLLEEMEASAGLQYGPPPPTSRTDTVALLVELLSSTNPQYVQEALEIYAKAQSEQEAEAQEGPADSSDSGMGGRDE